MEVDISEYAGYGGLIVANGGLEPNPDSFFARTYGFKVKLTVGEGETWSQLNNGRFAASATTTDVLAVQGRGFQVVVPAQIGWSRGADMLVVDTGVATVNQLAGKVLAASQFNEAEFFLRYLAREAGVKVRVLRDLDGRPEPGEVGLVFYEDANAGCTAYQAELASGRRRLNGCVGWSPGTDEVIEASAGKAKALVTNRNLLVVADILTVNKGFAEANPKLVKGLVHGLLEGNRRLRDDQKANLAVVARAFKWSEAEAAAQLGKVHLANLPENRAFFAGTIDAAGSFGGIFQSSVLAYGDVIKNPSDSARYPDLSHLEALAKEGLFAGQVVAIAPIKTGARGLAGGRPAPQEGHPLLLRAQLRRARQEGAEEPGVPRRGEAVPAGEPGLGGGAARPRGQRQGGRVPQAGGRGAGAGHGAQGHGAVAAAGHGRAGGAAGAPPQARSEAARDGGARLGGAGGRRRQPEPPGRGAVVHAGVGASWPAE